MTSKDGGGIFDSLITELAVEIVKSVLNRYAPNIPEPQAKILKKLGLMPKTDEDVLKEVIEGTLSRFFSKNKKFANEGFSKTILVPAFSGIVLAHVSETGSPNFESLSKQLKEILDSDIEAKKFVKDHRIDWRRVFPDLESSFNAEVMARESHGIKLIFQELQKVREKIDGLPSRTSDQVHPTRYGISPPTPRRLFGRSEDISKLKVKVLLSSSRTVIKGPAGVGKLSLAAYLSHDDEIRRQYCDGVLWARLGNSPDLYGILDGWYKSLDVEKKLTPTDIPVIAGMIRAAIRNQKWLIIIDDICDANDFVHLNVASVNSATIVTTRHNKVAGELMASPSDVYKLEPLDKESSREYLSSLAEGVIQLFPKQCDDLLNYVGHLPLAIMVIGKSLSRAQARGQDTGKLIDYYFSESSIIDTNYIDEYTLESNKEASKVGDILMKSLGGLEQDRNEDKRCFGLLGVYAHNGTFDDRSLVKVWACDAGQVEETVGNLFDFGLIEIENRDSYRSYYVHSLLMMLARSLLAGSEDRDRAELSHAKYYLSYIESASELFSVGGENAYNALQELHDIWPQIWKAFQWSSSKIAASSDDARILILTSIIKGKDILKSRLTPSEMLEWTTQGRHAVKRMEYGILTSRGNAYVDINDFEEASSAYDQAFKITDELDDYVLEAKSRLNAANNFVMARKIDKAEEYLSKLPSLLDKIKDPDEKSKLELAYHGMLGNIWLENGNKKKADNNADYKQDLSKALDHYNQSLTQSISRGENWSIGTNYLNIGICHFELERYSDAIEYYNKAENIFMNPAIGNKGMLAKVYENKGRTYLHWEKLDEAQNYLTQGVEMAKSVSDLTTQCIGYFDLGRLYAKKGDYGSAEDQLNRGLKLAEDKLENADLQKEFRSELAEIQAKRNGTG